MWPDQHGVADHHGVVGPAAYQRVLHHYHVGADRDGAEIALQHGQVEDA
jgi:hypothetical protein